MGTKRFAIVCLLVFVGSLAVGTSARAVDYSELEVDYPIGQWSHRHQGYPNRPSGLSAINRIFGYVDPDPVYWPSDGQYHPTCQARHSGEFMTWRSSDSGTGSTAYNGKWPVYFHNKLGGSQSSNLDYDVKGHYKKNYLMDNLKGGIYGYHCRYVSQNKPFKVSTHAWGIAVDIHARYEHYGHTHACHSISAGEKDVWEKHKWYWGARFSGESKDCMHFQYATGY